MLLCNVQQTAGVSRLCQWMHWEPDLGRACVWREPPGSADGKRAICTPLRMRATVCPPLAISRQRCPSGRGKTYLRVVILACGWHCMINTKRMATATQAGFAVIVCIAEHSSPLSGEVWRHVYQPLWPHELA
jgi:hypothetical protein